MNNNTVVHEVLFLLLQPLTHCAMYTKANGKHKKSLNEFDSQAGQVQAPGMTLLREMSSYLNCWQIHDFFVYSLFVGVQYRFLTRNGRNMIDHRSV